MKPALTEPLTLNATRPTRKIEPYMLERVSDPIRERRERALAENSLSPVEVLVIRELKKPLANIIKQLRPDIEKGAYSLVLGDDASGRIPTFIVGHVCKAICERNKISPPRVRFITGSARLDDVEREKKTQMVSEQIAKIQETVSRNSPENLGKVLIVTDCIDRGGSVAILINALRKNNWKADVATVGFTDEGRESKDELEEKWGTHIVSGSNGYPSLLSRSGELSGVKKEKVKKEKMSVFATPHGDNEKVRAGRALAQSIADEISNSESVI